VIDDNVSLEVGSREVNVIQMTIDVTFNDNTKLKKFDVCQGTEVRIIIIIIYFFTHHSKPFSVFSRYERK
jgi:hypothetical protein